LTLLTDESALLTELRTLAEQGRYRDVLNRLGTVPAATVESRTPFALLAAEAHGRLGEHTAAESYASLAQRVAQGRSEPHAELRARHYRGAIALERGDADRAEEHFAAGLEVARALGDAAAEGRCLNNLGIVADLRGQPLEALASYELALAAYQQAGLARGIAETWHNIGISRRTLGDLPRALEAAQEALRVAEQLGDAAQAAQALAGRAELHILAGDLSLAAAELTRAKGAYERIQHPVGLAETWRLEGILARQRGTLDRAVQCLEQAARLAREHGSAHTLAEIERDLSAALRSSGDRTGARAARERAAALYRRMGAHRAADELDELT
jgi:tetratricopeptide (TPR) repeat protein